MTQHSRPSGFTLIELLVVLAIIGIAAGLIVAAVQKVRSASAAAECRNNLRQIGLALQHHHDVHKSLSSGMRWSKGKDAFRFMNWHARLLPYIEQVALWKSTQIAYQQARDFWINPPHVGLATVIPLYGCPSDDRVGRPQVSVKNNRLVALTSYLGVAGQNARSRDGLLFRDSRIRLSEVTDGTSNTLLVGERPPAKNNQFGWWYAGTGQQFTGSLDGILGVRERNLLPLQGGSFCPKGPYSFQSGEIQNQCSMFHFWSLHSGGAHFAFADGSVRFLSYSAAPILPALASRSGGETVSSVN